MYWIRARICGSGVWSRRNVYGGDMIMGSGEVLQVAYMGDSAYSAFCGHLIPYPHIHV
jgi:hypothetical protein